MAREIISLQVGGCGLRLGQTTWEFYTQQHGITPEGYAESPSTITSTIESHFHPTGQNRYVPRTIFVDTCPEDNDLIRSSRFSNLYNPYSFVSGTEDTSYSPGVGFKDEKYNKLAEEFENNLRRQTECCKSFQGFLITHSLGGGTGSGFIGRILNIINDKIAGTKKKVTQTYTVLPSPATRACQFEDINATYGFSHTNKGSDVQVLFNNDAIYRICTERLGIANPTKRHLNCIMTQAISSTTYSYRFLGDGFGWNLDSFKTNLIPWPSCNLLTVSYAPLLPRSFQGYSVANQASLVEQCYQLENNFANSASTKFEEVQYISMALALEGLKGSQNFFQAMQSHKDKFAPFCQTGVKFGFVSCTPSMLPDSPLGAPETACCAFSNSSIGADAISGIASGSGALKKNPAAFSHIFSDITKDDLQASEKYIEELWTCYKNSRKTDLEDGDLHFHFIEKQVSTMKKTRYFGN